MIWRLVVIGGLTVLAAACEGPSIEKEAGTPAIPVLSRAASPSEALRRVPVSIGDRVRVVSHPITVEWGIAGSSGEIVGVQSSPVSGGNDPQSGEVVIGITVSIEGHEQVYSMSRHLVEPTNLDPGSTISMGERSWILTDEGDWQSIPGDR